MGFKTAKYEVINCLREGLITHELRSGEIDSKNLLQTGAISVEELETIVTRSRGECYSCSTHHLSSETEVHIIKTQHDGQNWYIKWYFLDPNSVFISVHN